MLVTTTIMGSKSFARFLIVCMLSFAVRIAGKLPGMASFWTLNEGYGLYLSPPHLTPHLGTGPHPWKHEVKPYHKPYHMEITKWQEWEGSYASIWEWEKPYTFLISRRDILDCKVSIEYMRNILLSALFQIKDVHVIIFILLKHILLF